MSNFDCDECKGLIRAHESVNTSNRGDFVCDECFEVSNLRHLIECNPDDIKLLKQEYQELTGKRYYTKR